MRVQIEQQEASKLASVAMKVIKVRRLYLARAHLACTVPRVVPLMSWAELCWPRLLGPPTEEDMFSVCLTQCIFNELRLPSVFHSTGLNDANETTYKRHIAPALGSINNNVTRSGGFLFGFCFCSQGKNKSCRGEFKRQIKEGDRFKTPPEAAVFFTFSHIDMFPFLF